MEARAFRPREERGLKILDRYISASIIATFFFGLAMFMTLLLAMNLQKLIEMIAEDGFPAGLAFAIFAYRIPGMLVYAFPMSVLLSILLVFNRMSSDSEMVAIRASGVSFLRLLVGPILVSILVTGLTFWISDVFRPFADKRASQLLIQATRDNQSNNTVDIMHKQDNRPLYSFVATNFDLEARRMEKLNMFFYKEGRVMAVLYAKEANWNSEAGKWSFTGATVHYISPGDNSGFLMEPISESTRLDLFANQLKEDPIDIAMSKRKPDELTTTEIRKYVYHLQQLGREPQEVNRFVMGLAQRYSLPFSCLVLALIGAPLGLRHHRTSSSVGLGISLLVIFAYYIIFHYLAMLGESGDLPVQVAAWMPNILGAAVGVGLIVRANR